MAKSRIEGLNIKNTGIDGLIQNTEPEEKKNVLPEEKIVRIIFELPESLKKRVQRYCVENDVSMKNFITNAMIEYLKREENK